MAPPSRVRKMRRIAPAIRIREMKARAGPVLLLGEENWGLARMYRSLGVIARVESWSYG